MRLVSSLISPISPISLISFITPIIHNKREFNIIFDSAFFVVSAAHVRVLYYGKLMVNSWIITCLSMFNGSLYGL